MLQIPQGPWPWGVLGELGVKTVEVVPVAIKVFGPLEQSLTPGNLSLREKEESCMFEDVHCSIGCSGRTGKEMECLAVKGQENYALIEH